MTIIFNKMKNFYFPFFILVYELAVNLSNDMYLPAVSDLNIVFKTPFNFSQMAITAWFAGTIIMNPVLGILSDSVERKNIILLSGLLFIFVTLSCAFTSDPYFFLICRFFQGLTVTVIIICGYTLIHDLHDDKGAIIITSWLSAVLVVAPMIGPIFGAALMQIFDWRAIFLFISSLSFFGVIGVLYSFPRKNKALNKINIFYIKRDVLIYKIILFNKNFIKGALVAALLFSAIIGWITVSPFLLMHFYHFSPIFFGLIQLEIFGSYILGTFFIRFLVKKNLNIKKIINIGMSFIMFLSLLGEMLIFFNKIGFSTLIFFMCIYSFTFGVISSPLNRKVLEPLMCYGSGKVMAIFDFFISIFATLTTFFIKTSGQNLIEKTIGTMILFLSLASLIYGINFFCPQEDKK